MEAVASEAEEALAVAVAERDNASSSLRPIFYMINTKKIPSNIWVITPFSNSAKIDAPKKYIGKRAYVIIVND